MKTRVASFQEVHETPHHSGLHYFWNVRTYYAPPERWDLSSPLQRHEVELVGETSVLHILLENSRTSASHLLGAFMLSACATAASIGDDAVQIASVGRVDATPFSDILKTKNCRAALDSTFGFARESRGMKNGVFVVQAFDCKADRIVANVSLNNYAPQAMFCFAQTESGRIGSWIAPESVGFFEYSYANHAYLDCDVSEASDG